MNVVDLLEQLRVQLLATVYEKNNAMTKAERLEDENERMRAEIIRLNERIRDMAEERRSPRSVADCPVSLMCAGCVRIGDASACSVCTEFARSKRASG